MSRAGGHIIFLTTPRTRHAGFQSPLRGFPRAFLPKKGHSGDGTRADRNGVFCPIPAGAEGTDGLSIAFPRKETESFGLSSEFNLKGVVSAGKMKPVISGVRDRPAK